MTDLAPPPVSRPSLMARALPGLRMRTGVLLTLLLLLVGFVSILWTPSGVAPSVAALQAPDAAHLLGTDTQGRDVLSVVMKSILTGYVVATVAVAIGLFIGVPLGVATSRGGIWAEKILLGSSGFFISLSVLGIAVILTALLGPSALCAMLAIGLFNVAVTARGVRDELEGYRGRDYVAASRLAGLGGWELARRHLLQRFVPALGAIAVGQLAVGVLLEAGLGFVGLSTQPPGNSLGLMLRDAQSVLLFQPMLLVVPGLVLLLIALGLHMIADGLRHRFGGADAA